MHAVIDVVEGLELPFAAFERLVPADGVRFERRAGALEVHQDMPRSWHQRVAAILAAYWVDQGHLALAEQGVKVSGGTDRVADVAVFASPAHARPDVMFYPAAVYMLLIEIVSDESHHRDTVVKLAEYAEAGIAEYWIADERPGTPWDAVIQSYVLADGGAYRADRVFTLSDLLGYDPAEWPRDTAAR